MSSRKLLLLTLLVFAVLCFGTYLAFNSKDQAEVEVKPSAPTEGISDVKFRELVKNCSNGDADSCLTVGYIYLRGVIGERDFGQARNYFEKACDDFPDPGQREIQCEAIAKIFETGKEARVDKKISAIFHEKAQAAHLAFVSAPAVQVSNIKEEEEKCSKGDIGVCVQLAEKYEFGRRGVSQDLDKAGQIYERACEFGNGMVCDLAGSFFLDKRGNGREAKMFFQRGCKVGYQTACDHLKRQVGGSDEGP